MSEQEVNWEKVTAQQARELWLLGARLFEERCIKIEDVWRSDCIFNEDYPVDLPDSYLNSHWEFRVKVE